MLSCDEQVDHLCAHTPRHFWRSAEIAPARWLLSDDRMVCLGFMVVFDRVIECFTGTFVHRGSDTVAVHSEEIGHADRAGRDTMSHPHSAWVLGTMAATRVSFLSKRVSGRRQAVLSQRRHSARRASRPSERRPWIGRVIAGRFVLERRLGKGGMGVVYLANHNVLRRPFAVKLLRREFRQQRARTGAFFREARVASSVDHANIVSIYDYGQTDKGEPYLVMEYVEGTLLYQLVVSSPGKCLHPLQAVDISLQVARALEHAHQGVHRDIKPENILITTVGADGFCEGAGLWGGSGDWSATADSRR